jgi:hypothetical protein
MRSRYSPTVREGRCFGRDDNPTSPGSTFQVRIMGAQISPARSRAQISGAKHEIGPNGDNIAWSCATHYPC